MHCPSACFERTVSTTKTVSAAKSKKYLTQPIQSNSAFFPAAPGKATHMSPLGSIFMRWAIFICLMIFVTPCISFGAQVTLMWLPNDTSASGYRVYQRQEGESYNYDMPAWSNENNASDVNACTIDGLEDDLTYYFVVRACGSGAESNDSNEVEFNAATVNLNARPDARAGANQTVKSGSVAYLDGSGSFDRDGDPLTYQFMQIAGPDVGLDCSGAKCSLTAPNVTRTTALLFELTVGDGSDLNDTAQTIILVTPDGPQEDFAGTPDPGAPESGPLTGNQGPLQPIITAPTDGGYDVALGPWISTALFEHPDDGDNHLLTQWHIINATTKENVMDLISANHHLTDLILPQPILEPSSHYSVRVRFFDDLGLSSDWSAPAVFTTGEDSKDLNKNSIPDEREVSAHTDLNNDAIPDIDQPSAIKSVSTHNGQYLMGVSIDNGGSAVSIDALSNVDPDALEIPVGSGDEFPYGILAYKIKVSQPGDSAYTTVYFSDPIDSTRASWTHYDSIDGWQDSSSTTVIDTQGYVVERSLQDGGEEDADGVANGVIIDLSGPMYHNNDSRSSLTSEDDTAAAGGASGGCFIRVLF